MNSELGMMKISKLIRREGALKYAGGSADAVIAAWPHRQVIPAKFGPTRTPGANRAQNGVTPRRDGDYPVESR